MVDFEDIHKEETIPSKAGKRTASQSQDAVQAAQAPGDKTEGRTHVDPQSRATWSQAAVVPFCQCHHARLASIAYIRFSVIAKPPRILLVRIATRLTVETSGYYRHLFASLHRSRWAEAGSPESLGLYFHGKTGEATEERNGICAGDGEDDPAHA